MTVNDGNVFYGVLIFMCIEYLWEFYLDMRQRRIAKENVNLPNELIGIVSRETYEKSRLYAIDKRNFSMVRDTFSLLWNVIFLLFNGLYVIWDISGQCIQYLGYEPTGENEKIQSVVFLFLISTMQIFIGLPLSIYHTFVLEEKHGFNKQTPLFFIKDKLKGYILQQMLSLPLCWGIVYIIETGGDYFFLYLWLFLLAVTFFLYTIYPDFIAPLFDKYIPLPPGNLRTEIEKFAKNIGFPLSDLYVVIGSKRSAHSNAYFYGFFKKKRIVLFDTLLKDFVADPKEKEKNENKADETKSKEIEDKSKKMGCDNYEILAVLGHEMGHWKLSHNIKNLIMGESNLLIIFILFSLLLKYPSLYTSFGFYNSTPVFIGLQIALHYVFTFYFALVKYLMAIFGRHFEFQADKFAKSLGRAHYLKKALIKLNTDNLEFPVYDPLYSAWHNSHPPLLERIQALDKED